MRAPSQGAASASLQKCHRKIRSASRNRWRSGVLTSSSQPTRYATRPSRGRCPPNRVHIGSLPEPRASLVGRSSASDSSAPRKCRKCLPAANAGSSSSSVPMRQVTPSYSRSGLWGTAWLKGGRLFLVGVCLRRIAPFPPDVFRLCCCRSGKITSGEPRDDGRVPEAGPKGDVCRRGARSNDRADARIQRVPAGVSRT